MSGHRGRHFLQIPGPTNVPDRVLRAMSAPTIDHRGPEFAVLAADLVERLPRVFRTSRAGRHLPVVRHGRVGGRARQHALAGRSRARVRDRPLRDVVAHAGRAPRPRGRARPGRLAPRRRPRGRARAPHRGPRPRGGHPRRLRRPQRDVDRRREPRRRGAAGDGRGRPRRAAARRHDLVARLDRLPPRRVGRRRDGRLLAEGPDAPARPRLQRRQRTALDGLALRAAAARLLGLGPDHRGEPRRRVPVHAGRRTCSTGCARRSTCCSPRASTPCSPATRATPRRRGAPSARGGSTSCRSTTASTPPR